MAFVLIAETEAASADNTNVTTPSIDTTGATLIVVGLSASDSTSATGSDSKGNTWTSLPGYGAGPKAKLFYCIDPIVGTGHNFTISALAGWAPCMFAAAFSGATVYESQNGSSTNQTGSVTPTQDNSLVISCAASLSGPPTPDSGFTITGSLGAVGGTHWGGGLAYKIQTTAAAENVTWTGGSAATIAVFKLIEPPTITTTSLPDGTIDEPYSETLAATGGTGAITWNVTAGALPAGLSLNSSTGEISGTPTTIETASFTVEAEDTVAATDTQALSISIVSLFGAYELLQITPGLRIESIAWSGPVLRASFGSGYGAKALVGNASGLHRWSIHSGGIWWDALDSMTIGGVSRFEYYWEFFKEHTTGDQEIFVIQWRDRYWHAQFADVEMSVEKFKNETIYQGGFEVIQRRVAGAAYNPDGSINLLATDLVAYWKLDEASGNAIDAHGSNDLTDTNTVGTAAGKVGNARDFEAANSEKFTLADNADLSIGDHSWTWTAWVYAESLVNYQAILGKSIYDTSLEYIIYHLDGFFYLQASPDGTGEESTSAESSAVAINTWYFVVGWYDATANTLNIQLNNGTVSSSAMATGGVDSAAPFELGHDPHTGIYWDGLIDEVGFWKRVLTDAERTYLYNDGDGRTYEDFV